MLLNWIGDWRTNKPFVRHGRDDDLRSMPFIRYRRIF